MFRAPSKQRKINKEDGLQKYKKAYAEGSEVKKSVEKLPPRKVLWTPKKNRTKGHCTTGCSSQIKFENKGQEISDQHLIKNGKIWIFTVGEKKDPLVKTKYKPPQLITD